MFFPLIFFSFSFRSFFFVVDFVFLVTLASAGEQNGQEKRKEDQQDDGIRGIPRISPSFLWFLSSVRFFIFIFIFFLKKKNRPDKEHSSRVVAARTEFYLVFHYR